MFLKHHKVVNSEAMVPVELVVKGHGKEKSFEPRFENREKLRSGS